MLILVRSSNKELAHKFLLAEREQTSKPVPASDSRTGPPRSTENISPGPHAAGCCCLTLLKTVRKHRKTQQSQESELPCSAHVFCGNINVSIVKFIDSPNLDRQTIKIAYLANRRIGWEIHFYSCVLKDNSCLNHTSTHCFLISKSFFSLCMHSPIHWLWAQLCAYFELSWAAILILSNDGKKRKSGSAKKLL